MVQYPMEFKVTGQSDPDMMTPWKCQTPNNAGMGEIILAIPSEFEGPGGGYSPEDLYALALLNCFIATFKVIAHKSKLQFLALNAEGSLNVDRGEGGVPCMKSFQFKVNVSGATDKERMLRILEKSSQSCLILNSVKTEKHFEFTVL